MSEILHFTLLYVSECLHLSLRLPRGAFKKACQKCKSVTAVTKKHKHARALDAYCICKQAWAHTCIDLETTHTHACSPGLSTHGAENTVVLLVLVFPQNA